MNTELILFVITATLTILNLFKLISIIVGNPIKFPSLIWKYLILAPDRWHLLYGGFLYQVYFWTIKLNIINL